MQFCFVELHLRKWIIMNQYVFNICSCCKKIKSVEELLKDANEEREKGNAFYKEQRFRKAMDCYVKVILNVYSSDYLECTYFGEDSIL
jgi:tetratricopeptide (TPR) repeat protein